MSNWIPGLLLLDTTTGKKYRIPMEGLQMVVVGSYDSEFEAEIQLSELLDPRGLEEVDEDEEKDR